MERLRIAKIYSPDSNSYSFITSKESYPLKWVLLPLQQARMPAYKFVSTCSNFASLDWGTDNL